MIFLTVGTVLPFDRLVKAIDKALEDRLITAPVFAQIGETPLHPRNMEWVTTLDKSAFDRKVADASFVIGHAGMGSIITALEHRKRLLVMPRRKCYGEHVNDHQVAGARRFAKLGCVLAAYDSNELPLRLREIESFVPSFPPSDTDKVAQRIAQFLAEVREGRP